MSIKSARKRKGITQLDLAAELEINQSTVSYWESGKTHPRTKLLPKLARLLDCTVDELLATDDPDASAS